MRTREMTYADYGMTEEDREKVKEFCKNARAAEKAFILSICLEVKEDIATDLYYSLIKNLSFERIEKANLLYMKRDDFYGYKKKVIYQILQRGDEYFNKEE